MKIENFKLKIIVLFSVFIPVSLLAFTIPAKPSTYVNDYAGMLSPDQVATLETKLENYEKQTTNEIAVVTIPSLDGDVIENVAQDIFTKWGIGKKDKDNGVLLLISFADRKTRIQTGYGVEGDLTDIATSYIQSDIVTPAFRAGDYYVGVDGAVDKIIEALSGTGIVPQDYSASSGNNFFNSSNWQFVLIFGFFCFQWIVSLLARSKSWWGGGIVGGVFSLLVWFFLALSFVFTIPICFRPSLFRKTKGIIAEINIIIPIRL